ncbi:MAG: TMEM165/GDT1 family protein [Sphingomonas bacterium]|nr:TMEM165/GDT1 family protein [Sphingomonas bacterium]
MAALIVAALAQVGDRIAWLAAILADRYRKPFVVVTMAALALAAAGAIAATFGALLAPKLTPEAKQLFLAIALILLGTGVVGRIKAPDRLTGWRLGAMATSFLGLFILAFGDGIQFVVLALAARTTMPWLAVIGATAGSLVPIAAAAILGERDWLALPLVTARRIISILFLVSGLGLALSATGLI